MNPQHEDALARIGAMSRTLVAQVEVIALLESQLSEAKAQKLRIEREDLPELLREFGLEEIKLTDGAVVSVKDEVDAKIPEDKADAAFRWLEERDFDGIIKTEVEVAFGRGEAAKAAQLANRLADEGFPVSAKQGVHPMTLKSFVKERMAAGDAIPFDLFGIRPYSVAKVKLPKS